MRIVRKVIDSNYLRDPALADYLGRSPRHIAVLTEFVLLEAHKKDPLITVPKSIAILAQFPDQVEVIRPSRRLARFPGRSAGLQRRLIDQEQSRAFAELCRQMRRTRDDPATQEAIRRTAEIASTHIDGLVAAAPTIIALFQGHVARFTPAELVALRTRQSRSPDMQRKLLDIVVETTKDVAATTSAIPPACRPAEIANLPVFRYCLCMMLLFIRWIEVGRQTKTANNRIANDVIDANIAAYATYFDGVLSTDGKLRALHREARQVLREIGGAVPAQHRLS